MIVFPEYVTALNATDAISFCQNVINDTDTIIEINGECLKFVDPFGVALLGACFHKVKDRNKNIRIYNLDSNLSGYLQRMDLYNDIDLIGCKVESGMRHDRSDSLVELTQLSKHSEVGNASSKLATAIVGNFEDIDPNEPEDEMTGFNTFGRLVQPLQYTLDELLENALTHARRNGNKRSCVWIASQYYPKNGLIRLGVVDNGCGFLGSLQDHPSLTSKRHLNAILLALQPRVSCNRDLVLRNDSVNEGVGLTTCCRIAHQAGGKMILISGDAIHDTYKGSIDANGKNFFWQGVGISIQIYRSKLLDVRFRELLPKIDDTPPVNLRFEQ